MQVRGHVGFIKNVRMVEKAISQLVESRGWEVEGGKKVFQRGTLEGTDKNQLADGAVESRNGI